MRQHGRESQVNEHSLPALHKSLSPGFKIASSCLRLMVNNIIHSLFLSQLWNNMIKKRYPCWPSKAAGEQSLGIMRSWSWVHPSIIYTLQEMESPKGQIAWMLKSETPSVSFPFYLLTYYCISMREISQGIGCNSTFFVRLPKTEKERPSPITVPLKAVPVLLRLQIH